MYCLVLVNWNLLGEEVGKGISNGEDQAGYEAGTNFMALDVFVFNLCKMHCLPCSITVFFHRAWKL